MLSALIGIATHLVWDSFTHYDDFVVTRTPWLTATLVGSLTWARALQHVSTVGGLAVIAVYAWRRRAGLLAGRGRTGAGSATRRRVLLATALVAGAVAHAWWWLAGPEAVTAGQPLGVVIEGVLSDAAKGACAGLIGGLAVYVIGWWPRPHGRPPHHLVPGGPGRPVLVHRHGSRQGVLRRPRLPHHAPRRDSRGGRRRPGRLQSVECDGRRPVHGGKRRQRQGC